VNFDRSTYELSDAGKVTKIAIGVGVVGVIICAVIGMTFLPGFITW
jgi:hypothetical protein